MTENCPTCRWFRPMTHKLTDGGLCRRYPPTLEADGKRHRGWPFRFGRNPFRQERVLTPEQRAAAAAQLAAIRPKPR